MGEMLWCREDGLMPDQDTCLGSLLLDFGEAPECQEKSAKHIVCGISFSPMQKLQQSAEGVVESGGKFEVARA